MTGSDADRPTDSPPSHLFTVRLWSQDLGDGRTEWRGKVQHVLSGETHYFRAWAELVERLASIVEQMDGLQEGD